MCFSKNSIGIFVFCDKPVQSTLLIYFSKNSTGILVLFDKSPQYTLSKCFSKKRNSVLVCNSRPLVSHPLVVLKYFEIILIRITGRLRNGVRQADVNLSIFT